MRSLNLICFNHQFLRPISVCASVRRKIWRAGLEDIRLEDKRVVDDCEERVGDDGVEEYRLRAWLGAELVPDCF